MVRTKKVDHDGELRTTRSKIGEGHQPDGKFNVADRDPGQRIGRAETKFEKPKSAGAGVDGESVPIE